VLHGHLYNHDDDSNPDFWINPDSDPDICQIAPKMLWIHCLVGVSHFAKFHKNQQVTVVKKIEKRFGIHVRIQINTRN